MIAGRYAHARQFNRRSRQLGMAPCDARFHRQRHGQSQEREQAAQFVPVGQVRGLQREAFGFEVAEHDFYRHPQQRNAHAEAQ